MDNPKSMHQKLSEYYDKMLEMQPKDRKHGGYAVVFRRDNLNDVVLGEYDFPKGTYRVLSMVGDAIHWKYEPKELEIDDTILFL